MIVRRKREKERAGERKIKIWERERGRQRERKIERENRESKWKIERRNITILRRRERIKDEIGRDGKGWKRE